MKWFALILLLMMCNVRASSYSSRQTLTIIIDPPPPCSLTVEDLDFGAVVISQIDNSRYKKMPLHFAFTCSEESQSKTVKIKIIAATLDDRTAQTSAPGLGVQFFNGNATTPLLLNSDIADQGQPADVVARGLSVIPFKLAGQTPDAGDFRAQITLQMEYQ